MGSGALGMRTVRLGATALETTSIGLGCAAIYKLASARGRARALHCAVDAGIRHFDVAPMYGLGLAEGELGRALGWRRGELTIATKIGIAVTRKGRLAGRIQAPARWVARRCRVAQRSLRDAAPGPSDQGLGRLLYRSAFDYRAAATSLDLSLKELGTDYVDLLLLHDPACGFVNPDEVYSFMTRSVASGRALHWGIAGEVQPSQDVAAVMPGPVPVMQVRHQIGVTHGSGTKWGPVITFGALGETLARVLRLLASRPDRARAWSEELGIDVSQSDRLASLLLREAFASNPLGTVLYGSCDPWRIAAAADIARLVPCDNETLERFRQLVRAVGQSPGKA